MNRGKALLMDALKLRFSYDEQDFESVINCLKNNHQDPFLVSLLELVRGMDDLCFASMGSTEAKMPQSEDFQLVREEIKIKSSDPALYEWLCEAEELIHNKKVFPTVKDLRDYLSQSLKITGKKTRAELTNLAVQWFSQLPLSELELQIVHLTERLKKDNRFLRMANKLVESKR